MDLKVKDVADLLNVSETTIHQWVTDGKIPAYKINDQYLFSLPEVEEWVMNRKPDEDDLPSSHRGSLQFSLYRAIHKGGVFLDIPGSTKEEIIKTSVHHFAKELNLDAEIVTELLLDRENLQATTLNNGIAVPHARDCILKKRQDVVTIVFPENPIPYGALDGKPVHTLFFLFAGDEKRHLHLLAKIAHLASQQTTLDFLKRKPSKQELLQHIKDWEAQIQKVQSV